MDTSQWLCPDNFCPPVIGNIYVYRDGNHMSDDYVLTLVPFLWDKIKNVIEKKNDRLPPKKACTRAARLPPQLIVLVVRARAKPRRFRSRSPRNPQRRARCSRGPQAPRGSIRGS